MDNISEQLVSKSSTGSDRVKKLLIGAATILTATVVMWLAMRFMPSLAILAVLILAGGIYLTTNLSIEYEYIVTNDEMDIDKIIGRRKRKRMITLDLKSAEDFGVYPPSEDIQSDATVHASTGFEKNAAYLIIQHKDYGKVMLIFNPNQKTREAIMQEVPSKLRIKMKNDA